MIFIYADKGVSDESLRQIQRSMSQLVGGAQAISTIQADQVIAGLWTESATGLIMPGGADVPYALALQGAGNATIASYVKNGGVYIGICAGAYYAGRRIQFDVNGPQEVIQDRELGFFPGMVWGPYGGRYDADHHATARAVLVQGTTPLETQPWYAYVNGGGYFRVDAGCQDWVMPLVHDDQGNVLMVAMHVGKGLAVLSSIHWEYQAENLRFCHRDLESSCYDPEHYAKWVQSENTRQVFEQSLWDWVQKKRLKNDAASF